jgi:hypothetical protein
MYFLQSQELNQENLTKEEEIYCIFMAIMLFISPDMLRGIYMGAGYF